MSDAENRMEELEFLVRTLLESSLPFVDSEQFTKSDAYRWAMICFCVGSAKGATSCESDEQAMTCATNVLVDLFEWPRPGTEELVQDALRGAERETVRMREQGQIAMTEFEIAVNRLRMNAGEEGGNKGGVLAQRF